MSDKLIALDVHELAEIGDVPLSVVLALLARLEHSGSLVLVQRRCGWRFYAAGPGASP